MKARSWKRKGGKGRRKGGKGRAGGDGGGAWAVHTVSPAMQRVVSYGARVSSLKRQR